MWRDEDYWEVAAYVATPDGFGLGYGITMRCRTHGEAQERREQLLRQGHRNVHVRRVTVRTEPESMTAVQDVASVRRRG